MRKVLTVLFVLFVLALEVGCGGTAKWTTTGGSVGQGKENAINALAYDSTHNLLYAGTANKGVWKYDGTTWSSTGGAVSNFGIGSLACDSGHNVLYAGVYDPSTGRSRATGVWKYDGNTWTDTNSGGGATAIGQPLACDSVHNVLYAGSDGGVWKYDVKKSTWTDTGGGVSEFYILSLAYDSDHNVLYAASDSMGVWKYDGAKWTDIADISTGAASIIEGTIHEITPVSLAYDSTHDLLYAGLWTGTGSGGGVWKYDGARWTDTGGGNARYDVPCLAYDSDHNVLYAGCYYALSIVSSGGSSIIGKGVWKYDGNTWASTGGGVSRYDISSLAYDSGNNILYASCVDPSASAYIGKGVWKYGGTE